jgi:hypothetical protein
MNDRLADSVLGDCRHQRCHESSEVTADAQESSKIAVLESKVSVVEPMRA